jgi:hypothetical protein
MQERRKICYDVSRNLARLDHFPPEYRPRLPRTDAEQRAAASTATKPFFQQIDRFRTLRLIEPGNGFSRWREWKGGLAGSLREAKATKASRPPGLGDRHEPILKYSAFTAAFIRVEV